MYKFSYRLSDNADKSVYTELVEKLSAEFPELIRLSKDEENACRTVFATPEDKSEKLCLTFCETEKSIELLSKNKIKNLSDQELQTLLDIKQCEYNTEPAGMKKSSIIALEICYLLMYIFLGYCNEDCSFINTSDRPFEYMLQSFIMSLPAAAICYFTYPILKRRTGYSSIRIRFTQFGGIIAIILAAFSIMTANSFMISLIIILLLACSVPIACFGMVTAIIFERIISFIKKRMSYNK